MDAMTYPYLNLSYMDVQLYSTENYGCNDFLVTWMWNYVPHKTMDAMIYPYLNLSYMDVQLYSTEHYGYDYQSRPLPQLYYVNKRGP